jgi:hypothetical protein
MSIYMSITSVIQLINRFQHSASFLLWTFFRVLFNWLSTTTSVDDLFVLVLQHVREGLRGILHFMCACAMWTLWKTRNDVVFVTKWWRRRQW